VSVKRIENNTAAIIVMPPYVDITGDPETSLDYPKGLNLVPGLNTVPVKYLEALDGTERQIHGKNGRPIPKRLRYPGREWLKDMLAPVSYNLPSGPVYGPRLTVHEDPLVHREDGPPPPAVLPTANERAAMALINVTSDQNALRRWSKQPKLSEAIRGALMAKINV
jgi:hypothetical protein